jgi:phosphohistidine phosphatase SixA
LCDYDDADCIAALQAEGFYMLSPEDYGDDAYAYPAIYKSPGIVWDQSTERNKNGDWMMMSREIEVEDGETSNDGDESLGESDGEATDSGETDDTHGGDHSDGKDENADMTENPVYVIYNDGRRNNTGMGLYYLGGTHEIGLAPHGTELNETPSKFIPLWMSDSMDIMSGDSPIFPRPGGGREGNTTGIVEHKGIHHVVFENKKGKFKKISFEVNDGNGIATSKGESKASKGWIKKIESKKSTDINGDGIIGDPADQTDGLSEGEHNNASFKNKMGSKKLLRELQSGGMVIYIRHATTEVDYADQADPDMSLDDCSTQRMLNDQGKAEAAAIGAGFEANDIIIGKVITSSYCRAKDTATIAFGEINKVEKKLNFLPFEDYTDEQLDTYHDRVAPMLSTGHKKGNKVIVGHDDPFEGTTNIYPDPQGTAYVLDPKGDSFEIIAQLQPDDWAFGADIQALG